MQGSLLLLLFGWMLSPMYGLAQVSPGPLSKAHQSLSGTTQCITCHQVTGRATYKCLECHTEIAVRISEGRGWHASIVKKESGSNTCRTCHHEHFGADLQLIKWDPSQEQFDHAKTGWPLVGTHAKQPCAKCHNPEHVSQAERATIQKKDFGKTFLGLNRQCSTCHQDFHQGKLGPNCSSCHAPTGWKSVPQFDHSKTGYVLTGQHLKTDCQKCHAPVGPEQKPRWKGLKFDGCDSCHKSPHANAFSNKPCQSCHTTNGFRSVATATLNSHFDHSKTHFALLGKHAAVGCEKCHAQAAFTKTLVYQRCGGCHSPSPHGEQFANRADGGECGSCHTVDGFKPAKFTVEQHVSTQYPLQGKHAALECGKCHTPAAKATLYRLKFTSCSDCHQDQHNGQFKSPPHLNRCQICHSVNGFNPSTFSVALHKNTDYPLEGPHAKVECTACHLKRDGKTLPEGERAQLIPAVQTQPVAQMVSAAEKHQPHPELLVFRFKDMSCAGCHADIHHGEFKEQMARPGKDGKPLGCEACHVLESWKNVSRFDHARANFTLVGAHLTARCSECHKLAPGEQHVEYRTASTRCDDCHSDVHKGQFKQTLTATSCGGCHNVFRWSPSTFDHDLQTAYRLEGEHKSVACLRCHTIRQNLDGKEVVFYKPTPTDCADCHRTGKIRALAKD